MMDAAVMEEAWKMAWNLMVGNPSAEFEKDRCFVCRVCRGASTHYAPVVLFCRVCRGASTHYAYPLFCFAECAGVQILSSIVQGC